MAERHRDRVHLEAIAPTVEWRQTASTLVTSSPTRQLRKTPRLGSDRASNGNGTGHTATQTEISPLD